MLRHPHDLAQRLQHAATVLSEIESESRVAEAVVETGMEALGASGGGLGLLEADGATVRVVATRGYDHAKVRPFRVLALDFPAPLTDAVRTGRPVLMETPEQIDAAYTILRELRGGPADRAVAALPLEIGGHAFGAIGFAFATPRAFTLEEREFMLTFAALCAQALDRVERGRLYDRTARLQIVTAELASSLRPEDVGAVVIDEVRQVLNADAGRFAILEPTGRLRSIATFGYPKAIVDSEVLPGDQAVAQEAPVLVDSLAALDEPWAVALRCSAEVDACAGFPLRVGDRVIGSIGFAWRRPRTFSAEDVDFLDTLANACAQALERTQLYVESEAARAQLRHLLDHLGEAVLTLDTDLRITYANAEARHLLARRPLLGRRLPAHWRGIGLRRIARAQLDGVTTPGDDRVTAADGRTFEIVAMRSDTDVTLVLRDVTRRERQEQAEREFVANAAHELRSPMAAIATAADALERGAKDLPAERDYFIGGIVTEVERLVRLSDALLVLARVQAQPSSLPGDSVLLEPLVTRVAATLDVKPGVRVRVDVDGYAVRGEPNLLEGALTNIARNASQHTKSGEIVFEARRDGDRVVLEVADTGPGLDEVLLERVTARFFRGQHDSPGFGLGLPIAQEMIRAIGGQLTIEQQRKRRGTRVRIDLPAA